MSVFTTCSLRLNELTEVCFRCVDSMPIFSETKVACGFEGFLPSFLTNAAMAPRVVPPYLAHWSWPHGGTKER